MRACGELILHFAADAVQTRQHFRGQPHHAGGFRHITAEARMEIDTVAHWHMAHVLNAANQAGLRIAGHNGPGSIMQRLHR